MDIVFFMSGPIGNGLMSSPIVARHIQRFIDAGLIVTVAGMNAELSDSLNVRHVKIPYRRWWWPKSTWAYCGKFNTRLRASIVKKQASINFKTNLISVWPGYELEIADSIKSDLGCNHTILVHDLHENVFTNQNRLLALMNADSILCVSHNLVERFSQLNKRTFLLPPIPGSKLGLRPAFSSKPLAIIGGYNVEYVGILEKFRRELLFIGPQFQSENKNIRFIDRFEHNDDAIKFISDNCSAVVVLVPHGYGDYENYSFPSKLLDACRAGLPIIAIASPTSSLGEWVIQKKWPLFIRNQYVLEEFIEVEKNLTDVIFWEFCAGMVTELAYGEFCADRIHQILHEHVLGRSMLNLLRA